MAVYPDSVIIEYYNEITPGWVDISAYVVGDIKGSNGLGGWRPDQRVGVLGTLNITLNNKDKLFSPMGGDEVRGLTTLEGFNKAAKLRVRIFYDDLYFVVWIGRIASIDSDDLNWGNEQVRIMAVDWMNIPVNYPMKGATRLLDQTIDSAMDAILARVSIQPESTDFDEGTFTFPAIFDNVQRKTMALSEFTKLANSELGYIYVKHDGTLRVENFTARQGWRPLDQVWIKPDTPSYLLKEDGDFLLLEDGGKIILDEGEYQDAALSTDAEKYSILLTEDSILNASIIRVHPVVTDTTLKVLYSLGTPLRIPAGRRKRFSAHYTNPNGYGEISGTNMQTPVSTTDYLANTAQDGSGTDKTADVVVTATYYADTVFYTITNNASGRVFITFLQARGYGIYYGNSIESTVDDTISQDAYGYAPFQFDQKYQKDTYLADIYGLSVIEEYKNPKSRITNMKYLANLNKNHMLTFLTLGIGALILLTEDRSNLSNHYYITDRAFTIKQGGIVNVEYGLKQNDSYLSGGLNPVTVEFVGGTSTDAINYGYLPAISDLRQRSLSVWIYANDDVPDTSYFGLMAYGVNYILSMKQNQKVQLYDQQMGDGVGYGGGVWISTNANDIPLLAWTHILVTHDTSAWPSSSVPIIYINGSAIALTESDAPDGLFGSEEGMEFVLGNVHSSNNEYENPFAGKIFDARVYDRILSAAEATEIYNSGVPDETLVTDGLLFQGPAVYSDLGDDVSLDGFILSSNDRFVENALRAAGTVSGAPIIRANP